MLQAIITNDTNLANVAIIPLSEISSTTVSRKSAEESGTLIWGYDISRSSPFCIYKNTN